MRFLLCLLFVLFINQLFCQIDFYIETDETCYSYGQDIYITFNLHNTTSDTVIVTFIMIPPYDYYIDDDFFLIGAYQMIIDITIPPDSIHSTPYIHTDNVSIGDHILIGEFNCNWLSDPVSITVEQVSVDFYELQPIGCQLSNYPNPFNSETTISFEITSLRNASARQANLHENTQIEIYNLKGQKVKTFDILESASPSPFFADGVGYSISWNGTGENNQPVCSGIYFYKLSSGEYTKTGKMLLLK